jgi:class 3 adenylate cyclase
LKPETKYARSGDVNIAYQVVGDGPRDLVVVPGFVSNLELMWENPGFAYTLARLASFSRMIIFDKRGTGLSDRVADMPNLETRMDDVRAVMDAVQSTNAVLLGISEGGPMSCLFAATYPERTTALILIASFARRTRTPDHPFGPTPAELASSIEVLGATWGSGTFAVEHRAPSMAGDERYRDWYTRYLRMGASPRAAQDLMRMNADIDVRDILPTIRVPTLVVHRAGDKVIPVEMGRHLAERIPGARMVEVPGNDHHFGVDPDAMLDEIEEFITGARHSHEPDRVLATVVFTDIVDATRTASDLGDRRWRDLLSAHHTVVREHLERFRGREIDTAGDGFLAAFDGPARAVRAARAISDGVGKLGLKLRVGVHTGECEVLGEKLSGIAVHIGARVAALASPGEVLVSSTVKDLVAGSALRFRDRGAHELKGVPGAWQLYSVEKD